MTEHTVIKTTPLSQDQFVLARNPLTGIPPVDFDQTLVGVNEAGSPHHLLFRNNLNQDLLGWDPAAIGEPSLDLDSLVKPFAETAHCANLVFYRQGTLPAVLVL